MQDNHHDQKKSQIQELLESGGTEHFTSVEQVKKFEDDLFLAIFKHASLDFVHVSGKEAYGKIDDLTVGDFEIIGITVVAAYTRFMVKMTSCPSSVMTPGYIQNFFMKFASAAGTGARVAIKAAEQHMTPERAAALVEAMLTGKPNCQCEDCQKLRKKE